MPTIRSGGCPGDIGQGQRDRVVGGGAANLDRAQGVVRIRVAVVEVEQLLAGAGGDDQVGPAVAVDIADDDGGGARGLGAEGHRVGEAAGRVRRVHRQLERAGERDAGDRDRDVAGDLPGQVAATQHEHPAPAGEVDEALGAIAEEGADVGGRDAQDGAGAVGGLLDHEVAGDRLPGDGQPDVVAFDAQVRARGQVDLGQAAGQLELLRDGRGRRVEAEIEVAGEVDARRQPGEREAADLPGQAGAGEHEQPGACRSGDRPDGEAETGNGDPHRLGRLGAGRRLRAQLAQALGEAEVAGERAERLAARGLDAECGRGGDDHRERAGGGVKRDRGVQRRAEPGDVERPVPRSGSWP